MKTFALVMALVLSNYSFATAASCPDGTCQSSGQQPKSDAIIVASDETEDARREKRLSELFSNKFFTLKICNQFKNNDYQKIRQFFRNEKIGLEYAYKYIKCKAFDDKYYNMLIFLIYTPVTSETSGGKIFNDFDHPEEKRIKFVQMLKCKQNVVGLDHKIDFFEHLDLVLDKFTGESKKAVDNYHERLANEFPDPDTVPSDPSICPNLD